MLEGGLALCDSATKLQHFAKSVGPLRGEDTSSRDPITQLLEIISQTPRRHFIVPFGQNEQFVGRVDQPLLLNDVSRGGFDGDGGIEADGGGGGGRTDEGGAI